jgi:hypothetical protein
MGNSTDLEVIQPENLGDLLREKVQAAFVSLVPDEKWTSLIEHEWRRFFHEEKKDSHWGRDKPSRLSELLREIISSEVRKHVQPVVEARLRELSWDQVCSAEAIELLRKAGPMTMQAFSQQLVQLAAQEALNQLSQRGY